MERAQLLTTMVALDPGLPHMFHYSPYPEPSRIDGLVLLGI